MYAFTILQLLCFGLVLLAVVIWLAAYKGLLWVTLARNPVPTAVLLFNLLIAYGLIRPATGWRTFTGAGGSGRSSWQRWSSA